MNTDTPASGLIPEKDRQDIQGFVTSSFGHLAHAAYLFFRFTSRDPARQWLRQLRPAITSARSWRRDADHPKELPPQTLSLTFTARGLAALGLPDCCLSSFPTEFNQGIATAARSCDLGDTGDSDPEKWHFGNDRRPMDGLAILCANSEESLSRDCQHFKQGLADVAQGTIVAEEFGYRPRDEKEPFGFRDGIAQPSILGIQKTGISAGEFILGYGNEYGYCPVAPMLRAELDPGHLLPDSPNPHFPGERDFGRNGTFLVYRKLEQDVAGFWNFIGDESRRLRGGVDPDFIVWLAAKMIGRWPGGAPLTLSPEADDPQLARADHFQYRDVDPEGLRCPFGAHIRRTHPRDQLRPAGPVESSHMTARHRILRRGRRYGSALFDLSLLDHPNTTEACRLFEQLRDDRQKRGLHFLCLNASIKSQFEFIQQAWINNARANGNVDNPDPMASRSATATPCSMLIPRTGLDLRTSRLPAFVTVRAGAYLFVPSLSAIQYLAQ